MRSGTFLGWVLSLVIGGTVGSAWAAAGWAAAVRGEVVDASGAGLPGAEVELTCAGAPRSVRLVTGVGGRFETSGLTATLCDLEARLPGFQPLRRSGVEVSAAARGRLRLTLAYAAVVEPAVGEAEPGAEVASYGELIERFGLRCRGGVGAVLDAVGLVSGGEPLPLAQQEFGSTGER